MKRVTILTGIFLAQMTSAAMAGNLTKDATIILASNSRNGGDTPYAINLSGGTGPCYTIGFYPTDFPDMDSFNRTWAQLLVAMTSGFHVRIANPAISTPNPANGDCWHGNYVEMYP